MSPGLYTVLISNNTRNVDISVARDWHAQALPVMNQLESALILTLRETIPWESSLEISSIGHAGDRHPSGEKFDASTYQKRDRQLAFRDLINAAAVAEVSIRVSDVWNYRSIQPTPPGAGAQRPGERGLRAELLSGTSASVRHVGHTSVPYDAAQFRRQRPVRPRRHHLRDPGPGVLDLHRPANPIASTAAGTTFRRSPPGRWRRGRGQAGRHQHGARAQPRPLQAPGPTWPTATTRWPPTWPAWPGAQEPVRVRHPHLRRGVQRRRPRAGGLRLRPRLLGGRDYSTVAGERGLSRDRLVSRPGDDHRQEPPRPPPTGLADRRPERAAVRGGACADSNRNRIVYNVAAKTLQWFRETTSLVHVPQIVALSIPGIAVGQTLDTLPRIPEAKDAQYWRQKAGRSFRPAKADGRDRARFHRLGYGHDGRLHRRFRPPP
jgi:hypothetical protein